LPVFLLNASVVIRVKVKHSVKTSARFSELKLVSENSIFHLCRSQLRSYHFNSIFAHCISFPAVSSLGATLDNEFTSAVILASITLFYTFCVWLT